MEFTLDVQDDGTYLTIKTTSLTNSELKAYVADAIDSIGLKKVDKKAVARLIMRTGFRRGKISDSNIKINPDEEVKLSVSDNGIEVYLSFKAPLDGGYLLRREDIYSVISKSDINYGMDEKILEEITRSREYGKKYLVAVGQKAENGRDGRLEFFFDNTDDKFKPVILEDGSVDYYNIKNVDQIEAGQILIRIHEATKGFDGINVYGKTIKGRQGKPPQKILLGKNVVMEDRDSKVVSASNGQIIYTGRLIGVSTVMEVKDDVGVRTGNISFNGSVIVHGDLKSDFTISAKGNVEVRGVCEGNITADGNITVTGGICGVNGSHITAGSHVGAKFITNCHLTASGNVHTGDILNSVIKSKGLVELHGSKGALVGSKLYAKEGFKANIVGTSNGSSAAEVYIGLDYELLEAYKARLEEYRSFKKEQSEITKSILYFNKLAAEGRLSSGKKKHLMMLKYDEKVNSRKLLKFKMQVASALERLNSDSVQGYLRARAVHQRVRIQIANTILLVKDSIYNSEFVSENSAVKIEPFVKS